MPAELSTLEDDDLYDQATPQEPMKELVTFHLGTEWYGIEIHHLKEVVKVPTVTTLPGAPPQHSGSH